ncbi:MAG: glycosyltransferase family 1 protein [bacterium]|jgi:glycosyltransferase involved in cell wall biosynthesis
MRIAIDGMLLGHRHSGVEGSILNLVQALAAFGKYDYTLFTQSVVDKPGATPHGFGGPLSARRSTATLSTRWPVNLRPIRILWEQLVLPSFLINQCFDLLHAPGYVAPILSRIPVVITLYDLIALSHPELCTLSNRLHYRLLVPPSVRKATRIIVPSETTRTDLLRYFPAAENKVRVIPLGVRPEFRILLGEDAFSRMRLEYRLPELFILFVGGLEPKKNLTRLIKAYRLLRQNPAITHQLVIAGVPSWDQANVRRAIREQDMKQDVIFTGFIPFDKLPLLYNMAALFVFPSLYEGFGLPPLEAMACGTPVVISDRGALPEIAGPAAITTDALATDRLAAAMETVLTDDKVRTDLIARGLNHVRKFSWANVAADTEVVYEEAASHA